MVNRAPTHPPARLAAIGPGTALLLALHPVTRTAAQHPVLGHGFKNRLSLRRHHPQPVPDSYLEKEESDERRRSTRGPPGRAPCKEDDAAPPAQPS
ncbi:hypothetical protein BCEP4_340013 [Burkholderia cepacia]|nr:hypothetical protein BCEP4_340013 [Burkholderia cepacia]